MYFIMKTNKFVLAAIISLFAFAMVGCSSTKLSGKSDEASVTVVSKSDTSPQMSMPPVIAAVKQQMASAADSDLNKDPLTDSSSILSKRSVYFDYDSSNVKTESLALIEAHGKYLASHTTRKVVIQGNTDERGGSEYNVALGQKRAEAVRGLLVVYGAKESQLEAVSFGKEKPRVSGSNEAAWAENRRVDLAY
jgi:peptidoglycan-associated lipoprotein